MKNVINAIKKTGFKINLLLTEVLGKAPPRQVPKKLIGRYTLDGKIKIQNYYINNKILSSFPKIWSLKKVESLIPLIMTKKYMGGYPQTNELLHDSLKKYLLKDKEIVVMGSESPYYESMSLGYGAKNVTTIEYTKIISKHPRIKVLRPWEYEKNPKQFDVGFSISSFEHDGLGRYGDPLNPEADLIAMEKMKKIIKRGGLLFLAVPVGKDALVWNAHRIYGKIRLPLLLRGWKIIDSFGFKKEDLDKYFKDPLMKSDHQPVFVLKNL